MLYFPFFITRFMFSPLFRPEEGVIKDVDAQLRKLALDYGGSGQAETTGNAAASQVWTFSSLFSIYVLIRATRFVS